MREATLIRPRLGLVAYVAVLVVCAIAVVAAVATGVDGRRIAAMLPLPLALAGLGWVTLAAPYVRVDAQAVTIANPFRTIRVPIARIESFDTHGGFRVVTSEGRFGAWAAPSPDRLWSERVKPRDLVSMRFAGETVAHADNVRTSALPGSASGDAAESVRRAAAGADVDDIARGADQAIARRVNVANIAVLALSLVAAGVASALSA